MDEAGIDACLFTSYHNICYFSGFLYCKFGRRYGAVLTRNGVTTVRLRSTAASPGGGRSETTSPIPTGAATAISPR
ncbi:MAG: hypothetical protein CM15mP115_04010 [Alphaproteobacteria bacterium]|nr:MAG: hypothetical protein CM15mP115_04010 [Alphaproteobacteria bacterium]